MTTMDQSDASSTTNNAMHAFCVALLQRLASSATSGVPPLKEVQQLQLSSINPMDLFAYLVPKLFSLNATAAAVGNDNGTVISPQAALQIITTLAMLDAKTFVRPAIQTFQTFTKHHVQKNNANTISSTNTNGNDQSLSIQPPPPELIPVLVQQACCSEQVEVAHMAQESLLNCCIQLFPDSSLQSTMYSTLYALWKPQLDVMSSANSNNKTLKQQASIIAVRAATVWTDAIVASEHFQDASTSSCSALFVTMLQDSSDPLLQISILDLLERITKQASSDDALQNWLLSESVLAPVLSCCGVSIIDASTDGDVDPILGGAALCVLSKLAQIFFVQTTMMQVDEDAVTMQDANTLSSEALLQCFSAALHQFAEEGSSSLTETEQLSLWDAISCFGGTSVAALSMVLDDTAIRHAWLSISAAKHPKLKAAQVLSIARTMDPSMVVSSPATGIETTTPNSSNSNSKDPDFQKQLQRLYTMIGMEQTSNHKTTTDLLIQWAASPIAEIRAACYALLTAYVSACGITGAQVVLGSKPNSLNQDAEQNSLNMMDWLLVRGREPTLACRVAKYELTKCVHEKAGGLLAEAVQKKLESFIQKGPHYMEARTWEVAVE